MYVLRLHVFIRTHVTSLAKWLVDIASTNAVCMITYSSAESIVASFRGVATKSGGGGGGAPQVQIGTFFVS